MNRSFGLAFVIAVFGMITTACAQSSSVEDLVGSWRGTLDYMRADGELTPIYFGVNVDEDDAVISGYASAYQIGLGSDIEEISIDGAHLEFEIPFQGSTAQADLTLNGPVLSGTLRLGQEDQRLELGRVKTDVDDALATQRIGLYEFEDGHELLLSPMQWALAVNDLTDSQYRVYFPQSDNEYIAGRGNLMPAPTEITLTFGEDEQGPFVAQSFPGGERLGRASDVLIEEEIEFQNGDVTLSGTMIRPRNAEGPLPGTVIVWGSGRQTRFGFDAAVYYRAVWLARHGFATLIWDKRGVGDSTGSYEERTMENLAADASEAVNFLAGRAEVDADRVGVFVHSQSGMYAPLIASGNEGVAYVVNLAGSIVNGEVQEIARTEMQLRADGWPDEDIQAAVEMQRLKFHYANVREGWDEYLAAYELIHNRPWFETIVGSPDEQDDSAWDFWRDGNSFEPSEGFREVDVPVLYLIGERDTISPGAEGIALLHEVFAGQREDLLTVIEYNGAEHSLFEAQHGGLLEEIQRNQLVPYMDQVLAWLEEIGMSAD